MTERVSNDASSLQSPKLQTRRVRPRDLGSRILCALDPVLAIHKEYGIISVHVRCDLELMVYILGYKRECLEMFEYKKEHS